MSRMQFAAACRGVLRAPPVRLDAASGPVLVSQVQHKDLLMYLLALKSFSRQVPPRAVYALDDGSLTAGDRAKLREHVPGLTLLELAPFRSPACPQGGTWERLLAIAALAQEHYVIQLDSDTLTLGPVHEVREAVGGGRAFALGTWNNQKIETMGERCATAKKVLTQGGGHIQVVAEAHFHRLRGFESLRYVRGCSAFAGFPRRSFARAFVEAISAEMRAAIGSKWDEWGSEQVMSNIVVANTPGAVVLPHPKYADCHKMQPRATEFVHFIGSCRFTSGAYARLGAQAIASL